MAIDIKLKSTNSPISSTKMTIFVFCLCTVRYSANAMVAVDHEKIINEYVKSHQKGCNNGSPDPNCGLLVKCGVTFRVEGPLDHKFVGSKYN